MARLTFPNPPALFRSVNREGAGIQTNTMNADTITTDRLADLKALLQTATDTVSRLHLQSVNGDISTQDAAAIVNETAETINKFCKD